MWSSLRIHGLENIFFTIKCICNTFGLLVWDWEYLKYIKGIIYHPKLIFESFWKNSNTLNELQCKGHYNVEF